MKVTDFWYIAPRSLVEVDRRFSGAYCLIHQGDYHTRLHVAIFLEAVIFYVNSLIMEAFLTSDMSNSTRLHGATSQKIVIFV
jgi:hypothetical protein